MTVNDRLEGLFAELAQLCGRADILGIAIHIAVKKDDSAQIVMRKGPLKPVTRQQFLPPEAQHEELAQRKSARRAAHLVSPMVRVRGMQ